MLEALLAVMVVICGIEQKDCTAFGGSYKKEQRGKKK